MKTTTTLALLLCTGICTHAQSYIDRYLTDPLTYTTVVNGSNQVVNPRDLDFKPNTNELWVMMRGNGNNGGDFVIVHNAGLPNQTSEYRKDSHSSHFMTNASAMAFSDIGEWAAVSEIQNTAGGNSTFMGPALWLGDLNIFATVFQSAWVSGKPLGSHIDMLHQSPYAMGIAWDTDKAYWVMDGHNGNIARYDFVQDHGPGYDDHSAGGIKRYTDVTVTRVPNVPSHMVMDHANNWLYFIDGGAKKIKRMNTTTGTIVGNLTVPGTATETLMAGYKNVTGATVETIDTWTGSARPCGIDYADGRLIVSDNFNGDIKVYDVTGTPTLLGTIATGQSTIMGVKIGTDGSIWFVNNYEGQVVRINAAPVANDAAITAIASPATVSAKPDFFSNAYDVCSGSVAPSVTLTNAGSNTLTSVVIDADIDGVSASFTWTGSLGVGNSTNVVLPVATIGTGSHLLTVTTGSTNGTSDPNPMNDRKEGSFRSIDAPLSVPFVETFGGSTFPPTDWNYVHFNPNDFISHNTTTGGFGLSTGCAKMDNYSGSMNITGQEDYLMLPRIDLSGAPSGTTLDFSVAHAQYQTSNDRLVVNASTDCGSNWTAIYDRQGSQLSTAPAQSSAFTPTAAQWRAEQVDLASYVGQPEVLLMFVSISNYGNNVYIDDVQVGANVGINEATANIMEVFPNPNTGRFAVRIGSASLGNVVMDVITLDGTVVHSERWSALQGSQRDLDLSVMGKGSYVVRLTSAQGITLRSRIVIE